MRKVLVVFSLLACMVAGVVAYNARHDIGLHEVDWRVAPKLPTKKVKVEHPQPAEIIQTVTAPGTIELVDEADIASQIMGMVKEVRVEKGDQVRKGDLLVKLDDEDAKARLASTEARIERLKAAIDMARADLEKAQVDSDGYRKLEARGFSTPNEVRDGETTLAKREAVLEMSEHELKESFAMRRNSEQDVERTEIRAPMDGTVIDLDVEVGEIVIAGTTNLPGTVLMTIGDMNKMRVRADVDETDVGLVRPNQPVRIYLQADQTVPIPGKVRLISPKGKRLNEVVSFETLISVDGDHDALRPEMTATVEIEVRRAVDVLSVPVQAVVHRRVRDLPQTTQLREWIAKQPATPADKGKELDARYVKVVFVVDEQVARVRPVQCGISDEDRVEIIAGLDASDTVIVGPFRALDEMADGQPVEVETSTGDQKKQKQPPVKAPQESFRAKEPMEQRSDDADGDAETRA